MPIVLAALSSGLYGVSDFVGGLASRRFAAIRVTFAAQLVGLVGAVAVVGVATGRPTGRDLLLGAVAGAAGGLAVAALFRGLAVGSMGVVAPLAAAVGAVVPVVVGLGRGERPSGYAVAGIMCALVAVVLLTIETGRVGWSGVPEAIGAGAGFGTYFVLLDLTSAASGPWPLVSVNLASVIVIGLLLVRLRGRGVRNVALIWIAALVGAADLLGDVLYLAAVRREMLTLVAVLVALYPVTTVILARAMLGERFTRLQLVGVPLALMALSLIAIP